MRVRGDHAHTSFARLGHGTQGLVPSPQELNKEQSFSPDEWIYCSRKCWEKSRAAQCMSDPQVLPKPLLPQV